MAATTLSLASRDVFNRPKRTLLRFASTATLAQLQNFVTGFVPLQRAIQGPTIEAAEVTFSLNVPANDPAAAGVNAQNGANFSFQNASLNSYGIWVPGINATLMVGKRALIAMMHWFKHGWPMLSRAIPSLLR